MDVVLFVFIFYVIINIKLKFNYVILNIYVWVYNGVYAFRVDEVNFNVVN